MADTKASDETAASALSPADGFAIVQGGADRYALFQQVADLMLTAIGDDDPALTPDSDDRFPTKSAVKAYADNKGDAFTNTSTSVDSEVALFSSTTGKLLKRASASGTPYLTSGVLSINKITLTQPATGATLTILDGKTATFNKTLTLDGTDGTTMTFPPASASIGYLGIPQNSQSSNYTTVAADAGKHILHPSGAGAGDTVTIAANGSVAYEIGTAITFVNMDSNAWSIAIATDTMYLAGAGTTGTRSLAQYGVATAVKTGSTEWLISGTGLT